ncbi:hypothetical protein L0F63_004105 [Massospora cicadina]|nr:hypothetical protein L0F63_004105 [Massospora cicadina]
MKDRPIPNFTGDPSKDTHPHLNDSFDFNDLSILDSPAFGGFCSTLPSPSPFQTGENITNWLLENSSIPAGTPSMLNVNIHGEPLISPTSGYFTINSPFLTQHLNTPADAFYTPSLGQGTSFFSPLMEGSITDSAPPLITDPGQVFYSPLQVNPITSPPLYAPDHPVEPYPPLFPLYQVKLEEYVDPLAIEASVEPPSSGIAFQPPLDGTAMEPVSSLPDPTLLTGSEGFVPAQRMPSYPPHHNLQAKATLARRPHLVQIRPKPLDYTGPYPPQPARPPFYPMEKLPDPSTGPYVTPTLGANFARATKPLAEEKAKRRFVCEFEGCGMAFTRLYNKKTHHETHFPHRVKPHPCNLCPRRFDRKHDLGRHLNTVHRKEQNICAKCGKPFAHADALANHVGTNGCANCAPNPNT